MIGLSNIDIEQTSLQELEERNSIMPPVKPMPEGHQDDDDSDELELARLLASALCDELAIDEEAATIRLVKRAS